MITMCALPPIFIVVMLQRLKFMVQDGTPDYAAFNFDHQLAALICIQHSDSDTAAPGRTLNVTAILVSTIARDPPI
eukprot:SAG31_NODE_1722_length_7452_cov_2.771658_10_plen_76_part_00